MDVRGGEGGCEGRKNVRGEEGGEGGREEREGGEGGEGGRRGREEERESARREKRVEDSMDYTCAPSKRK